MTTEVALFGLMLRMYCRIVKLATDHAHDTMGEPANVRKI